MMKSYSESIVCLFIFRIGLAKALSKPNRAAVRAKLRILIESIVADLEGKKRWNTHERHFTNIYCEDYQGRDSLI